MEGPLAVVGSAEAVGLDEGGGGSGSVPGREHGERDPQMPRFESCGQTARASGPNGAAL